MICKLILCLKWCAVDILEDHPHFPPGSHPQLVCADQLKYFLCLEAVVSFQIKCLKAAFSLESTSGIPQQSFAMQLLETLPYLHCSFHTKIRLGSGREVIEPLSTSEVRALCP